MQPPWFRQRTGTLTVCVLLGIAPVAAIADEDRGWYLGVSMGRSTSSLSASDAQSGFFWYEAGVNVDNRDSGGRVFGGFRFSPHLAAEFGIVNLGYTNLSGRRVNGTMASTDQLRARGIYGAVVGKQPLVEGIALLGKLGVGAIEGVVRCSDVSDVCVGSGANFYFVDGQARVTAVPVWGLGVQLDMHTRFAARLEYERFGGVEFAREGHMLHVDYKLTTAGFLYKF